MKRIKLIVHGRVQGVFYRANTVEMGKKLGLTGYAKNLEDGTVEVVAEGQENELKELIKFCKEGPEHASVENVDMEFQSVTSEFSEFEIRE